MHHDSNDISRSQNIISLVGPPSCAIPFIGQGVINYDNTDRMSCMRQGTLEIGLISIRRAIIGWSACRPLNDETGEEIRHDDWPTPGQGFSTPA